MARPARVLVALLAVLGGCASPGARFEQEARQVGLRPQLVRGTDFVHALFVPVSTGAPADPHQLHVYLDGDGTPTVAGLPADDPTQRNPLVLRLLALDPGRALYLGRPCYHGVGPSPACEPHLWTDARYGEAVVASMATALRSHLAARPAHAIWWFGYSGGGTLAMLLAERFPETEAVVTIAGNLDLQAFARRHGRDGLAASLDPAARPPLSENVVQRHYLGAEDPVIPRSARISSVSVPGFDHRCCWAALWPRLLAETAAAMEPTRIGAR